MNIKIDSRKGHFNLANPSQESIYTHIALHDGGHCMRSINLNTEDLISDDDYECEFIVDEVVGLIEDWNKRTWISTARKEINEFKDFIIANKDQIIIGTMKERERKLREKQERIQKEIEAIQIAIKSWVEAPPAIDAAV